nr:arsenate reductase (glutaredoxin) [Paraburkholderia hayleyella]
MTITIYHNPQCSKSRQAYDLISDRFNVSGEPVEVVNYLVSPLTVEQLRQLACLLGCSARGMLRTTETQYTDLHLDDPKISEAQLYQAMETYPLLLQRPIVVRNGRAVIGRPPENIKILFD